MKSRDASSRDQGVRGVGAKSSAGSGASAARNASLPVETRPGPAGRGARGEEARAAGRGRVPRPRRRALAERSGDGPARRARTEKANPLTYRRDKERASHSTTAEPHTVRTFNPLPRAWPARPAIGAVYTARPASVSLSQEGGLESELISLIAGAAAQRASATGDRSRARGQRRQAGARREEPEVAGEDGKLDWAAGTRVPQEAGRVPNAGEAVGVRGATLQDRSRLQVVPVLRQEGHWHDQDAQGPVRHRLLHHGPHQTIRLESVDHLPMIDATGRAGATGPVGHAEAADSFRVRLVKPAPEARAPRVGLGGEGVHGGAAPAGGRDGGLCDRPQRVRNRRAEDRVHVDPVAELGAAARRAVDALGHQGEARDVERQAGHVDSSHSAVEAQCTALYLGRLGAALAERGHGRGGVVAQDAVARADVDHLRECLESQGAAQSFAELPHRFVRNYSEA